MPFLIGGVFGAAVFVVLFERAGGQLKTLNRYIRLCAIASVGAMIGSNVSSNILSVLPEFWISIVAILPFIVTAHAGNYLILRKLGKYSVVDAYFSSMPGGLVEAILLGEKAGADMRVMTVQHFIRVLSVVVAVPVIFLISTGEVVGSAAGGSTVAEKYGLLDIGLIFLLGLIGLFVGRFLKLPAAHLLGPLVLAVFVSVSGLASITVPGWLLNLAQFVVGATLGAQFSGISMPVLKRGFAMGLVSMVFLLSLAYLFAMVLAPHLPAGVPAMFISFTAGGLAEMSLIALSLELSPVVVALHHLVRIFLVIWVGNQFYKRYLQPVRHGGPD